MKKNKNKVFEDKESIISFHGKDIKLSEAKTLLSKLKDGSINIELNELERIGYNQMNEGTRRDNAKKKARGDKELYEEFTEKGYLELLLEIPISVIEHFNKIEACKRKGHKGESVLSCDSSGKALCYCHTCEDMYDRRMTSKESMDFDKLIKTPMTI
jgi:hypothetical protein